jgi:hypothetical protein
MVKRVSWIILLTLLLSVFPLSVNAQTAEPSPLDWIPADFSGFIQMRVDETALAELNFVASSGALLQPTRVNPDFFQGYESFIPLTLLDVEDATFSTDILPWLDGEIILAYHELNPTLEVTADDVLMILPMADALVAASVLGRIIRAQDLLETTTYRGVTVYIGDKTTIALTTDVVFVGSTELVQSALDRRAGEGERLTDQPAYTAVRAASPSDALVFAYINGDNLISTLSILLSGGTSAEPLLTAFGEALSQLRDVDSLETALLSASVKGIGVSLKALSEPELTLQATATFFTEGGSPMTSTAEFDPAILNLIPRSAMVVDSGADVSGAVYDVLAALPLSNFAGAILGAFPVEPSVDLSDESVEQPSSDQLQAAVSGFLNVLNNVSSFNLEDDLLTHLSGNYAVALIPRPNDPAPLFDTPFDVLLVAEVNDNTAALDGATRFLQTIAGVDELDSETVDGIQFRILRASSTDDPALWLGVKDGMLIVATGSALEQALDAQRGDNRLVNHDRWKSVSIEKIPQLYVNLISVYDTFFPNAGGQLPTQTRLLTANSQSLDNGLFQLEVLVHWQQ